MKRFLLFIAGALLLGGMPSCSRPERAEPAGAALSLRWGAATKGAATPEERRVNTLVFYIFDDRGLLDVSYVCNAEELAAEKAEIRLKTGTKTVWAVANLSGASLARANACTTQEELESAAILLTDNAPGNFVMTACAGVNLSFSETPVCELTLTRPVAKVILGSVANRLPAPYGSVVVRRAFLCNVVGNQNIAGTADADPAAWINPEGTPDGGGREHTIGQGGYPAQAPDLTFRVLEDVVPSGGVRTYPGTEALYAFANGRSGANDGYARPFVPTATVLMLVVQINRIEYYYPVALQNGLVRNTDNVVNITLSGLGNTLEEGPFNKLEKGGLTALVTVSDWRDGFSYGESL